MVTVFIAVECLFRPKRAVLKGAMIMQAVVGGQYTAELAGSGALLDAALALRSLVFRNGADDRDGFDPVCDHIVVTDVSGQVVACARVLILPSGAEIGTCYAAQFYNLSRLEEFYQPMAELGRFCVHPDHADAEVLRVIWGALTKLVDDNDIGMLFGCTSFSGATVEGREAVFGYLADRHLAPEQYAPEVGSLRAVALTGGDVDTRQALREIPPLLRTYLTMGAWVSDHAVFDDDLDTLHVFTGLEISKIPEGRKRLLRALSGS
jgi:putative hemolysin